MKSIKKISSILLSVSLMVSALGTGAVVSADTTLPNLDGNYIAATDYSVLTPGTYKDTVYWEGRLDTTMEIFTDGILIDTGNFGVGQSNFHGFEAYDTDSDGKTDFIETQSYNNEGARFTLGLNANADHTGAKALAIKVDNVNIPDDWVGALQSWAPTLICSDGTSYNLKPYSSVDDSVVTYFLNTADGSITKREYNDYSTGIIQGRVAGYMIFPFDLFEGDVDATKVTQVALSLSTYWGVNNRIYELGFVTDINGFLGIVEPLENSGYITMATDFSALTPSDTDYLDIKNGSNCVLDTESELFANGYMTDDSSVIGIGTAPMTNFHGFYAKDINADGGTDYLEAYPYDYNGMRFTLGMTEEPDVSGEAIAIHIAQRYDQSSLSQWIGGWDFTLNTSKGAVSLASASAVPSDVNYYFYNATNGEITTYNYATEGWLHVMASYPEGWMIIPLEMFAGEVDTADISSIKFSLSSYWNSNTIIYGVGYVTDMYAMLGLERPVPPVAESEYLTRANDLSSLVISSGDNSNNYNDAVNGWNCVLDTTTALFTNGVVVDTGNFGIGEGASNFHGFYARDCDADGVADTLETYPYNDGGMRFTLGLNGTVAANGDGIAIHFSYIDNGSAYYDGLWIDTGLTVNTKSGSYALKRDNKAAYFITNASHEVSVRNLGNCPGLIAAKKDGWLVLPIEAFGNIDTADIISIDFDIASTWSYNLRISEISVVSDVNNLVGATLGDIDWNGAVETGDLVILRKLLLGVDCGNIDGNVADVKQDGIIDIIDLIRLKKGLAA